MTFRKFTSPPCRRVLFLAAGTILVLLLSAERKVLRAAARDLEPALHSAQAAPALNIVPQPWKLEVFPERFFLGRETSLVLEDSWAETAPVAAFLAEHLGWDPDDVADVPEKAPASTGGSTVRMTLNMHKPELGEEGYLLTVTPGEVRLAANAAQGLFYGVQTLRQALRPESDGTWSLPCLSIEDRPRFPWRGMLLDCGRHFMSKEFIKRTIDLLAVHKMNRFHWHLTEDQGWRVEIKKYPLLTEIGAWRSDDGGGRYGGFYSQEDIREVVDYARKRFVTVIPEIEMPGHSVAALASYPVLSCRGGPFEVQTMWGVHKEIYCAGSDQTFAFLEDVLTEIIGLFPAPYVHIGGDEVPKDRWKECWRCQARIKAEGLKDENELQSYFIRRIETFLNSKGRRLIGWDEILEGGLAPDATVQSWRGFDGALAAVRSGHEAIVSPVSHAYFDFDLRRTDLRQVYSFEPVPPGLTTDEERRILGGECNMWTEYAPQETIDGKVFPRILAMAEALWSRPQDRDFSDFRRRLQVHATRLESLGVRIGEETRPLSILPRLNLQTGKITAVVRSAETGLDIRYTLDGSRPSTQSAVCKEPVEIKRTCRLRAAAFLDGRPYGQVEERDFVRHLGLGGRVRLSPAFSRRYPASGSPALADGVRGSIDHRDGAWQGFEGSDLEVIVDLGQVRPIYRLACGFFQHASIGVFLPEQVEFSVSRDGKTYVSAGTVWPRGPRKISERIMRDVAVDLEAGEARYVRVRAGNIGPCPAGHPLAGEKSWIFVDEFIID